MAPLRAFLVYFPKKDLLVYTYFAGSCGGAPISIIRQLSNSRKPQVESSLIPYLKEGVFSATRDNK